MPEGTKRVINRLESMHALRAVIDDAYTKAVEASKSGNPVVWSMSDYWEAAPILKIMGVAAVYPENYGAMCAAFGVAPTYLELSGVEGFPDHICGYARNCLGYSSRMMELGGIPPEAPGGGMAKPTFLIGSTGLCDSRFKWFQALGKYWDAPLWVFEIPHPGNREFLMEGAYENNVRLMVENLKGFIDFLEHLLGKKMDWDKLDEMVNDHIELNRIWYEINELRKAIPGPMHSRDFWTCMTVSLFSLGDYKVTLGLHRKLYDEVKYRVDNKIGAVPEEKYRMLFTELPPWHSLGFFDKLAERGWNFVFESWAYHPPKPQDLSMVRDPLERIARHTLNFFTGYHKEAVAARDMIGYFSYPYQEYVRDNKIDGAMLHSLLTCRAGSTGLPSIQDTLLKKLKVPSLIVSGDIVDLTLFDPADTLRKAEAFEQTMDYYRAVRREEGFDW